uniref:Kinesin motor domain-containing protein n=1 Tax=Steinernema glaseri TaxID=37863 RepID=A0A1I7YIQ0_9BILA
MRGNLTFLNCGHLSTERSHELDVLVRKVKELSSSIPSDSRPSTSMTRTHSILTSHSRQSRIPSVHIEHHTIPHRHEESTSTRKSTGSRCANGKAKIN